MDTQTQDPPVAQRKLVAPRGKKSVGLPSSGMLLLVGHPKSGKTTLAAAFPDSYVLELEQGGGDHVAGRIDDIANLEDFRSAFEAALADESIRTIVVDTIDVLTEWLCDEIAGARGLSKITERKPGVDGFEMWGEMSERIDGFIKAIKSSGKMFILLAHCREPKLDDKNQLITPAGINAPGKAGSKLAAAADMIGYTYKKQVGAATEYNLTFQGGPLGLWGSRIEEVNDKTVRLGKDNPYASFAALFGTNGNGNGKKGGKKS
jgi:hypothetical protein